ncbi:MAG TPA: serine/threonine-protein kinase [Polyangiales bacterium]|nr:serine/threonine-protein kinase [Polyangiales bacterium]
MSRTCPSCGASYPEETFFCGTDGFITIQEQDPADFDPRLGKQLGGYVVVARVADGAMGRVYEGRHSETKARVAIKVLHEQVARDRVAVERFKREYETAQELKSPYIVQVLDYGATPDRSWFMTMEFLEGEELSKAISRGKPLALPRIVRVLSQVGLALEHAHSFGFIHRDLKPDNVFLCSTEAGAQVRLLDFGSVKLQVETGAKLTALGTTLGSPCYMSPEQATGAADVDQQSDVFAVGSILYEMLTAKVAFDAPTVAMILLKILNQQPAPASSHNPAVNSAIESVITRAIEKDKSLRYPTARALADGFAKAVGIKGTCEEWATRSEAEIAEALAAVPAAQPKAAAAQPKAAAVPSKVAVTQVQQPRAAAAPTPSMSSGQPVRAMGSMGGASDAPLRVPRQNGAAKWIVVVAIGIVLLGLVLLMR